MLKSLLIAAICATAALLVACFFNPYLVYLSYKKKILDMPNYRKLQRRPVPVLGGMSVYLAVVVGIFVGNFFYSMNDVFSCFVGITIMFYTGLLDDMKGIKPISKLIMQIIVVSLFCSVGLRLDNLCGLFGIYELPLVVSIPLSIVAGVGLINALNLLDGIDGLSSGFSILSCTLMGLCFVRHADPTSALLAVVFIGALLPFFFCNTFSCKYKMFIGDSGSLILGTLAYYFCCKYLDSAHYYPLDQYELSVLISIYAIPVFDTLRVMTMRMVRKISPFTADKTHMHHIIIALRVPHFMASIIIILDAFLICVINYCLSLFMWSPSVHLFASIGVIIVLVWGPYAVLSYIQKFRPKTFRRLQIFCLLRNLHYLRKIYRFIQHFIDHIMLKKRV